MPDLVTHIPGPDPSFRLTRLAMRFGFDTLDGEKSRLSGPSSALAPSQRA
jgi:hypothetical protein